MQGASFRILDHTADVGVEIDAGSPRELFETGARALFELIADLSGVRELLRLEVSARAADQEELLVRWLSEWLYLSDTQDLLMSRFRVLEMDDRQVRGEGWGEPRDPSRHAPRAQIKAVTYHQVRVRRAGERWRGRVIFDV